MGNTCPLPVLTPNLDGLVRSVRLYLPDRSRSVRARNRNSPQPRVPLHRMCTDDLRFRADAKPIARAESTHKSYIQNTIMKTAAPVCPVCSGSGWKLVPGAPEHGVTRCDCRLQARGGAMIAAARIPKRYQ